MASVEGFDTYGFLALCRDMLQRTDSADASRFRSGAMLYSSATSRRRRLHRAARVLLRS